ncbi:substrate-binding domain-containing protein [Sporomusa termitida]|uniref:Tungstate ABC transporter binding protein WtpA n=1 Tax=Sporomusa termitida TaxID=2377 RepID=A0A517DQ20_9FIRM|nr:substrate-binding domain-containing protein [Sporomusa termitida]QDR79464.1 tungstate ABC transporter binding protein WtpA [Sporomusa termitida]
MTKKLTIFHAGSLSRVLQPIALAFELQNPGISVHLEGSGARMAARKAIQHPDTCDIVASADYSIIDDFLKPEYATFNIQLAKNRLVLSFSDQSQYANAIQPDNWYNILLKPGVTYGHTDPELDPAGYRTKLCWQLAERYYKQAGLFNCLNTNLLPENILTDSAIIRSRLTSGKLDYFFGYESTARQNSYRFINLPDAINFSADEYSSYYEQAALQLSGKQPGTVMTVKGQPIIYSITLIETTRRRDLALQFLEFLLDQGTAPIVAAGLIPLSPPIIPPKDNLHLPFRLRRFFNLSQCLDHIREDV